MAVTLESVIHSIFYDSDHNSVLKRYDYRRDPNTPITPTLLMEIPINQEVFEVPMFALDTFVEINKQAVSADTLVAQLYSCGLSSHYKSLDAIMRDCLSTKFSKHLTKVSLPNAVDTYYCTFGAIFNSSFKPLMILSWLMEKKTDGDGRVKYHYKRPILRINPGVCVSKEDALQRFIANKMLVSSLNNSVCSPYFINADTFLEQSRSYSCDNNWYVKVEIDECPLVIRRPDVPSISVTNQELLQIAANHIEEVLQI